MLSSVYIVMISMLLYLLHHVVVYILTMVPGVASMILMSIADVDCSNMIHIAMLLVYL